MEIGPIAGIPSVSTIKPTSAVRDLSGVFAVELRKQAQDDAPEHQRAARGLEDEESEEVSASSEDEDSPDEIALDEQPQSNISFFA